MKHGQEQKIQTGAKAKAEGVVVIAVVEEDNCYIAYKYTATMWQAVPNITKMCHIK